MAPIPQPPNYVAFTKAQIVEFTSGCPSVAASTVYFTNAVVNPNATNNGQYRTTLKQVAFWEFDDQGRVLKYDAWIPNLRLYSATSSGRGTSNLIPPSPAQQATAIQTLCGTTQKLCYGNNTQYTGVDDCAKTLTAKPFGDGDNYWSDSVSCRQIHVLLARIRPDVRRRSLSRWLSNANSMPRSIACILVPRVEANVSMSNTTRGTLTIKFCSEKKKARISCVLTES